MATKKKSLSRKNNLLIIFCFLIPSLVAQNKEKREGAVHVLARNINYFADEPGYHENGEIEYILRDSCGNEYSSMANCNERLVWSSFSNIPEGYYSLFITCYGEYSSLQVDSILVKNTYKSYVHHSMLYLIGKNTKAKHPHPITWNGTPFLIGDTCECSGLFKVKTQNGSNIISAIQIVYRKINHEYSGFMSKLPLQLTCTDGNYTYKTTIDTSAHYSMKLPCGKYYCFLNIDHGKSATIHKENVGSEIELIDLRHSDTCLNLHYTNYQY